MITARLRGAILAAVFACAAAAPALADPLAVGARATLSPSTEPSQQAEASVIRIQELDSADTAVKLYATTGGDPAINGLYTYIAAWESPEAWRVFFIGDFAEWRVLRQTAAFVELEVTVQSIDEDGNARSETQRLRVTKPGSETTRVVVSRIR